MSESELTLPAPRNTEAVTPLTFPWGEIRWLSNAELEPGAEMTFGVVTIQPGLQNDLHMHPNCEEVIFVLTGSCDHKLGDESYPMKPGDALRIPTGVWHCAAVTSAEPCTMVIAYSSPDRQTVFQK